ncbi:MAG: nitrile hydratase subunit beta [Acidimicrobiales bacterium]
MNGVHDLGGMHGFGPVDAEPEAAEPVFHHPWEALTQAAMLSSLRLGQWSLDEFRATIERLPPLDYLGLSYYEKWLRSLEQLLVGHGLVSAEELASGRPAGGPVERPAPVWAPRFEAPAAPAAFAVGRAVRVRNRHPEAHTRAPRYVRGRVGQVEAYVGGEPLPEDASVGVCTVEHLYRVRFEASELWGEDHAGPDPVYLELWESYLEPA